MRSTPLSFGLPSGVRRLAAGLVLAVSLSGCGLLFPGYTDLPEDLDTPPLAFYKRGQATVTLGDGTKVVLDRVGADSNLVEAFGATVHWIGDDGWHVRLSGAAADIGWGSYAYLSLDRIEDGEHLTIWDSSRCIIDVTAADENAVRGTATCKGLEWSDALSAPFPLASSPAPGAGEPKFDAEIVFEAFPAGDAA
jgi:hypothetical protein